MPKLRWLLLVAPLLMAQDYGSGVAHVGAVSGAPPAAAGGASPIFTNDFELSTCANDKGSPSAGTLTESGTPDCDYTTTTDCGPIPSGSHMVQTAEADDLRHENAFAAQDEFWATFQFCNEDDAAGGSNLEIFVMYDNVTKVYPRLGWRADNQTLTLKCSDATTDTATSIMADDTFYTLKIHYDTATDDGELFVDGVSKASCNGTGAPADPTGYRFESNTGRTHVFDLFQIFASDPDA